MTWMHQWWDFVRYPWVDLTGFMVLIILYFFSTSYLLFLRSDVQYVQFVGFKKMIYLLLSIYTSSDATLVEKGS